MKKSTVALVACASYDQSFVESAVGQAIKLIGGIETFVQPGETILLKPNTLMPSAPDKCVTTHPSIMRAVGKLCQKAGGIVSYGDGPGGGMFPIPHVMKQTGLAQVAQELGLPLADFVKGRMVSLPDGLMSKKISIVHGALDVDAVISLPKCKTHGLTRFTGAVKNQYGCLPGPVKGEYHARFSDLDDFGKLLVDICRAVHPRLYIMDAVIAMEGNGPQAGDPRKLGCILASTDPIALDAVACRIIGLDPEFVPTSIPGEAAGLGNYHAEHIEIVGERIESFSCPTFNVIRKRPVSIPKSAFFSYIKAQATRRPVIKNSACTKCGTCVRVCPLTPKALDWKAGNRKIPPIYNYNTCIRCFCCQEMCPSKAIDITTPLIGKLLPFVAFFALLFVSGTAGKKNKKG